MRIMCMMEISMMSPLGVREPKRRISVQASVFTNEVKKSIIMAMMDSRTINHQNTIFTELPTVPAFFSRYANVRPTMAPTKAMTLPDETMSSRSDPVIVHDC